MSNSKFNLAVYAFLFVSLFSINALSQSNQHRIANPAPTPNADDTVRVTTEEIQINVFAQNEFAHFDPTLTSEDLMVVEDGSPHALSSLRRVPASVLIVLDTGGEMRVAKSLQITQQVAANLVRSLEPNDAISILQYHDKAEILSEWTNKEQALETVAAKLNFGRRSRFVEAMELATRLLNAREPQNRHLVLIADGVDNNADKQARDEVLRKIIAANVSVHVLSYTGMEIKGQSQRSIFGKGAARAPRRTDDINKASLPQPTQDLLNMPRLGTINLDREMLRRARKQQTDLLASENQLSALAKDSGGVFYLPENAEQMIGQAKTIAETIDSQYVATYIPRRALSDSKPGEVREIGVVARRVGLQLQARRKFVVPAEGK